MRPATLLALVVAVPIAACTAGGDGGDAAIDARVAALSGSIALVRIDREVDASDAAMTDGRAVLGAVFARYRAMDGRQVLTLLGEGRAAARLDACATPERLTEAAADPYADVELLDVGALAVEVSSTRADLSPRTFPDLGSLLSGAFYANDVELAPTLADSDEYRIQASGSLDVGAFEIVLVGPPGPEGVRADGAVAEGAVLVRGSDLDLAWDAGDPRDRIEIDVLGGGRVVECVARDDGAFRIGGAWLERLGADASAKLVLRRVRLAPFDAEGIDAAWVRVATSRAFAVTVR